MDFARTAATRLGSRCELFVIFVSSDSRSGIAGVKQASHFQSLGAGDRISEDAKESQNKSHRLRKK